MPFDELERRCFVVLSRMYLDEKICSGCSDFDAHREVGLTDAECDELHRRMAAWNEPGSEPLTGHLFSDWFVFAYLRGKFLKGDER
jgi:hypothetical protein